MSGRAQTIGLNLTNQPMSGKEEKKLLQDGKASTNSLGDFKTNHFKPTGVLSEHKFMGKNADSFN